ncbi:MAG TPA: hypothetical protein PKY82_33530 [Pyrinomonadaceae bacterium]|nr:hypothetical protein [Pyrinomonadaceae bacterium]
MNTNKLYTDEFFAQLYDKEFPGLEFDWVRLCRRVSHSFNYAFEGKTFDLILDDFHDLSLPRFSHNLVVALSHRRELGKVISTYFDHLRYAEQLLNELDGFTEKNELHLVEILVGDEAAQIRVSILSQGWTVSPRFKILEEPAVEILNELTLIDHKTLAFSKPLTQFEFSSAFAVKDANEIISYILAKFEKR